jgi:DHA1 family bicyclomycin/chloramphenicol resistance-like MFS transporter
MNPQIKQTLPKGFIVILAMLTSISPLAIDVYLPSFTQISKYFYTSIDQIEVTLSIYLIGFAIGQLIGGPLSDRYGRKMFIFVGLSIYILFSFMISIASSVEQLWVFRFFQAIGGGFAVVNTSAIVRDIFHGKEGAKVFSMISMVMMLAPMVAPIIGATILHFFSWQFIFIFLSLYAIALLYFITKLPETSPKNKTKNMFANYMIILKNKNAVLLMIAGGFGISALFIFITKSSFIYMEYYKLDTIYFSLLFGLNAVGLIIATKLNIILLEKHSTIKLFLYAVVAQICFAIGLYFLSPLNILSIMIVGFVLYVSTLGLIFANVLSLLLEDFKTISATATALNGVIGFSISAFVGFIASVFHDGGLDNIFYLMITTSFISLVILLILIQRKKKNG